MKHFWWIIKCFFGAGDIADGSICWFSAEFFDVHDYHIGQGGDGTPSHFYTYTCPACGREFTI